MTNEEKVPATIRLTADEIEHRCEVHDKLVEALEELIAMDDVELLQRGAFKNAALALAAAKGE